MTSTSPNFVLSLGEHRLCTWPGSPDNISTPYKKESIVYNGDEWEKIRTTSSDVLQQQHHPQHHHNTQHQESLFGRMQLQFVLAVTGKSLFGRIEHMFPSELAPCTGQLQSHFLAHYDTISNLKAHGPITLGPVRALLVST
jgi:hypothetical protein